MTQQEIHDAAHKLLFEESGHLSREEFTSLLFDIIDDCRTALDAMEQDDIEQ